MLRVLLLIALRNLFAHKWASLIVGSIIFFGTFLVVIGSSMLDSVDRSMQRSITASLAGHLQIYSADAEDDLTLFGGGFIGGDDFGEIDSFAPVRTTLEAIPNVAAVVPMGIKSTLVVRGNEVDLAVEQLRNAVKAGDDDRVAELRHKLKNIAGELRLDLENRLPFARDQEKIRIGLSDLDRVLTDRFWQQLEQNPEPQLFFLEANIAQLSEGGRFFYLRQLGTDIPRFVENFSSFELVEGELIPPGERGVLLSTRFYEGWGKNRVANHLDRIKKRRERFGATFADDPKIKDRASRLPRQYPRIKNELTMRQADDVTAKLRGLMPDVEGDLVELLKAFLTLDDANFSDRYEYFYEHIAPLMNLYSLPIGEEITVRAVTKSGYLKAVKLKVWGTFRFKSLEESDLAGAQNLVDLVSFRELYGVMTEEKKAELAAIREEVGAADVAREGAEDALFGGGDLVAEEDDSAEFGFDAEEVLAERDDVPPPAKFTQAEVDGGMTINAAVVLKNPDELWATKTAIEEVIADKDLGLKVIDWQTASGIIGQFILVLRGTLYAWILIIFVVALVIINNSMVMATLERTSEIGTMRAMGAQRRFVAGLFLVQTAVLGFIAGTTGGLVGILLMVALGHYGVPAFNEQLVFVFSGPRLFPTVGAASVVLSFIVVMVVSLASTLYPAVIAARIQPVVAMQEKE